MKAWTAPPDETVRGVTRRPELCDTLESIRFFARFTAGDIEALSGYVQSYVVPAGEALIVEGEKGTTLFFLVSGRIELSKEDGGRRTPVAIVRPGSILGEMSIADNLPASATAVALEPTRVVALSRARLQSLCEHRQALAIRLLWQIMTELSARLRKTTGTLVTYLD